MNEEQFAKQKFSDYYAHAELEVPQISQREFGLGTWEEKIAVRHLLFPTVSLLKARLSSDAPFFISHSSALYEFPDARPMQRKNWLGADLIFDLDAPPHTCGKFTCNECLEKMKVLAHRLVEDFLCSDFGFSKEEIAINFSGNRGYHVHVRNEALRALGRDERRELVDYISGTGVDYDTFFKQDGPRIWGPSAREGGYGGKFVAHLAQGIREGTVFIRRFPKDAREAAAKNAEEGNWTRLALNKDALQRLRSEFNSFTSKRAIAIDANVTCDISKLIRMPGSLHGSSGLIVKKISSTSELTKFQPLRDAIAHSGEPIRLQTIEKIPQMEFANSTFGPFDANSAIEVPESLAVYLLCKRAAQLQ